MYGVAPAVVTGLTVHSSASGLKMNEDPNALFARVANGLPDKSLVFRRSFIREIGLTPAILYGSLESRVAEGAMKPGYVFPDGFFWTCADLETGWDPSFPIHYVEPHAALTEGSWAEIERTNALIASPDGTTLIVLEGSDYSCWLAKEASLELAFGCSVAELDAEAFEFLAQQLGHLDARAFHPIDRLLCITSAWLVAARMWSRRDDSR